MKLLKRMLLLTNSPPKKEKRKQILTIKTIITMKTFKIIIASVLLFSVTTNAQITKGNWMVGGNASYSSSNAVDANGNKFGKSMTIQIAPNLGYFFIDKLVGGAQLNFNYGKPSGGNSSTSYGISPFLRYYFLKPEKRVNILAEASFGYGITKPQNDKSNFGRGYVFKAGPVIYFNSSVGLELTANYNSSYLQQTNNNYNNFTIGFGLQIHLEK